METVHQQSPLLTSAALLALTSAASALSVDRQIATAVVDRVKI